MYDLEGVLELELQKNNVLLDNNLFEDTNRSNFYKRKPTLNYDYYSKKNV